MILKVVGLGLYFFACKMTADTIIAYTIKGKFNLILKLIFKIIIMDCIQIDYKKTTHPVHIARKSRRSS